MSGVFCDWSMGEIGGYEKCPHRWCRAQYTQSLGTHVKNLVSENRKQRHGASKKHCEQIHCHRRQNDLIREDKLQSFLDVFDYARFFLFFDFHARFDSKKKPEMLQTAEALKLNKWPVRPAREREFHPRLDRQLLKLAMTHCPTRQHSHNAHGARCRPLVRTRLGHKTREQSRREQ